ncbi:MAG: HAD-IA family hydrolase [Myxococcota bacterium]
MRAVIFDMDGVLVDSEPFWVEAELEVLGGLGVPLTPALCATTTGMRLDAVVEHWLARHPWTGRSVSEVQQDITRGVADRIRAFGEALPGMEDAVRVVREGGLAHAIATSSPHAVIDAVVERLGLHDFPVCSAMDEAAGKPDPAVYLTAARRIGVDPAACVAIEDSAPGVASARAAGMFVVAVQPVPGADVVVPTPELAAWLADRP